MTEPAIISVHARRIWDSRGRPTVEAEVTLSDGAVARGIAPAGASRGTREAVDLRDGGDTLRRLRRAGRARRHRRGDRAGAARPGPVRPGGVDARLIALDGTPTKPRLGGNATVAVSLAVLHAAAASRRLPLWRYLAGDAAAWRSRCPRSRSSAAARMPAGASTSRTSW